MLTKDVGGAKWDPKGISIELAGGGTLVEGDAPPSV
jgi:hypothetical protein